MRISDAAAAAGTTPRALRLYEQRGLLPPPSRTPSGQRRYAAADVARVLTIRRMLSLGLTIEDLRACADRSTSSTATRCRPTTAPHAPRAASPAAASPSSTPRSPA
ncbi:MerR family transcriptional regulator [Actinomadura madurae]|uniref:MerR family transcriptional regulator n=1 Tax=Actinomadura madurae TaxID=1993 RepID=UPI002025ED75|nr:MerR family transcriptional regulator [Actinomadura madurae]URM97614.1 MerR family transcriptional regulator [Actinomadura madurae]